jgi:hypothetical protein
MGAVLPNAIEGSGFDKGFDDTFINGFITGANDEVAEVLVGAIFLSFGNDKVGSALANALNGSEAKTDTGLFFF